MGVVLDWLAFISKAVDAVAWPAVVVGVLIWLRKPVENLATALRSAKIKDIELSFENKLAELECKAEVAKLPEPGEPPAWVSEDPSKWTFGDYIERLAIVSPRAAISEAWRHVETALREALRRIGRPLPRRTIDAARLLHEDGRLPQDAVSLVDDLRALRNQAVHAGEMDIDSQRAVEFGRLAERLIASINVGDRP